MSSDTRSRILVEAERLFAEQGFAGTRLARIAEAAGLGNAGLLHHFGSKAALYRAVLDSIAEELNERTALGGSAAEPAEELRRLVDGLVSLNGDRPTALAIIAHEFLDQSGRVAGAQNLPLAGIAQSTVAILEAGQRSGAVRQGDPVAMAAALHGALIIGALGRPVYRQTTSGSSTSDWEAELARSALCAVGVAPVGG